MKKRKIGSSFDSWLREEGVLRGGYSNRHQTRSGPTGGTAMREKNFSKAEMARRMQTSRAALDRLLDPEYEAVT